VKAFVAAANERAAAVGAGQVIPLPKTVECSAKGRKMRVEYRDGESAFTPDGFLALARRVWPRNYDVARTADALGRTINIGAWVGDRLVGSVRVLSDGYFFNTVPELMVDPEYQRQGIGRELMHRALDVAPGGKLFFGAQSGNEEFFERCGFHRGPVGFVGATSKRLERLSGA
jgi:GNAT superfamily N-acetyltransferase